jgi:CRISPR/Cas system CSM-associated protein Csm3 (group 7 of RAMP superfamily)
MMIKEKSLKLTVRATEPLRIGAKKDPLSGAENAVTRVGGSLAVPGSSLKGALRNQIEAYLIGRFYQTGGWQAGKEHWKPCIPGDQLSADERRLVNEGKYRSQNGTCRYPCTDDKCARETHSICPVCYLLGAMTLPGFVRVPFLLAEGGTNELIGVRLDRATKSIPQVGRGGPVRSYELVPQGTGFSGTLFVTLEDTVTGWQLAKPRKLGEQRSLGDRWLEGQNYDQEAFIKEFILDRLAAINAIGGYKSKGFGRIEITTAQA